MKLLAAALAVVMGVAVAHAAQAPDTSVVTGPNFQQMPLGNAYFTPNGGSQMKLGDYLNSPTFFGPVNTNSATGYQINGFPFAKPGGPDTNNNFPGLNLQFSFDPATHSNTQNSIIWNLNTTTTSSNINEMFDSRLMATGTGTVSAEINQMHSYMSVGAGLTIGDDEGHESSFDNVGTIGEWDGYLALPKNGTTGIVSFAYGLKTQPSNANTAANSFGTWAGLDCEAKIGAGTAPVASYCVRNADPNQLFVTAGRFKLAQAADLSAPTAQFQMNTADSSSANLAFLVNNNAGVHTLILRNDGAFGVGSATQGGVNAALTVADGAGNALGAHIGFVQTVTRPTVTNATIDATGGDTAGTLTLTAAAPVVTFGHAFATTPHCVVSASAGTAITGYTATTTALTLAGGDATTHANYVCIQ